MSLNLEFIISHDGPVTPPCSVFTTFFIFQNMNNVKIVHHISGMQSQKTVLLLLGFAYHNCLDVYVFEHWVPSRGRSESAALGVCVYIVFIYTQTPSAADSLRPRDGTQCV